MKKKLLIAIILLIGVIIFISTVISNTTTLDSSKPLVLTTILPTKQIVEKIAGDTVNVEAIIQPGFNPATYDLTVNDIKKITSADLYFRVGYVDFERTNLEKLRELNPNMDVIDTAKKSVLLTLDGAVLENQDATQVDPHTWLSPVMVQQQAEIITNALIAHYPNNKSIYEKNLQTLLVRLTQLDNELRTAFKPIKGKTMLVYHPAFGYLAHEYGFKQEFIQIDGKDPSVTDLKEIISKAKQENIKVIFVQKQFSSDSARSIAENIGGVVVQVDPLAEDYLSNISIMAQSIQKGLQSD